MILTVFEGDEPQEIDFSDPRVCLDEAGDRDPERALTGIRELRSWLAEMEEEAVIRARAEGYPWGRIAGYLGRSKQSVWEKHRDPDERSAD